MNTDSRRMASVTRKGGNATTRLRTRRSHFENKTGDFFERVFSSLPLLKILVRHRAEGRGRDVACIFGEDTASFFLLLRLPRLEAGSDFLRGEGEGKLVVDGINRDVSPSAQPLPWATV